MTWILMKHFEIKASVRLDASGFTARFASVRRFVATLRADTDVDARVVFHHRARRRSAGRLRRRADGARPAHRQTPTQPPALSKNVTAARGQKAHPGFCGPP